MTRECILVVDDEAGLLRTVERVLGGRYEVVTALGPEAALERIEEIRPDLAILDIYMGETDGFALMEQLRARRPDLDFIIMTGVLHELDTQIVRSIREKAFYFIQKPFDRELLLTLVERCLELRRLAARDREHVTKLEKELEEARAFQQGMLPPETASLGGFSIAARYLPCEELAGDFYDYTTTPSGAVAVLVADVCGHGVSAAMLVGIVKSAFHDAWREDYDPLSVVDRTASSLRAHDESRYVTLACARFDRTGEHLEYTTAGHPPPLLFGDGREVEELPPTGSPILRAIPDPRWWKHRVELRPGDRFLLYTDGITETPSGDEQFGEARFRDLLLDAEERGPALLARIVTEVDRFAAGRPPRDDRTLLLVEREEATGR
jgi:sigma-B regulation protein RsbU (phosphoserine phosphatase)